MQNGDGEPDKTYIICLGSRKWKHLFVYSLSFLCTVCEEKITMGCYNPAGYDKRSGLLFVTHISLSIIVTFLSIWMTFCVQKWYTFWKEKVNDLRKSPENTTSQHEEPFSFISSHFHMKRIINFFQQKNFHYVIYIFVIIFLYVYKETFLSVPFSHIFLFLSLQISFHLLKTIS